jgi:cytochrome o ubiquinol oxidase subunit II
MILFQRLLGRFLLLLTVCLGGCNMVVMRPSGDIAAQQAHLIVVSTLLMLLIIVPVILLTLVFAWRYRKSNTRATYSPDWDHSTSLELVIWGAPLLIIIALGVLTWVSTHTLDPYRPLQRLDAERTIPAGTQALTVEVVALDWKWLFIYPELGIASVNQLVAPVDVPIHFKITASTVMNSFYIPALAGQIYAMPGMTTQLNAVINKPGVYGGFSANYSGAGFSGMHFKFQGMPAADFAQWVKQTQAGAGTLGRDDYLRLQQPSSNVPVQHFAKVLSNLFDTVVNRCVEPGKMCMSQMMDIDSRGGMGMNTFEVGNPQPLLTTGRRYVLAQSCSAKDSIALNDLSDTATSNGTRN